MKHCLTISFLLLLSGVTYCQNTDLSSGGKEPFITHDFFDIYDKALKHNFKSVSIYEILTNKKGKSIDSTLITRFPLPDYTKKPADNFIYTYDTANREWQRFEIYKGVKTLNAEKLYDSIGQLSQWIWYSTDSTIYAHTFYYYNKDRKLIHTSHCYGYNYLHSKNYYIKNADYEYVNSKLVESKEYYKESDEIDWSNILTKRYDTLGNLVYYKDERGKYFFSNSTEFDSLNHKTKELTISDEKKIVLDEFFYWPNGLPRENKRYITRKKKKLYSTIRYYFK